MQNSTDERTRDCNPAIALPRLTYVMLLLGAWTLPACSAAAQAEYPRMAPVGQYLIADRASEIALARSAAPKPIADKATILTLGKGGYETAIKGTNGFVCFVERSWANDFDFGQFWNPRLISPQCWNAAAASSLLQDYLARTKWALSGASTEEMAARTKAELANHQIGPPAPGSMAYMLSKHQYFHDPSPSSGPSNWYPHVMFFVPATDGSPWGANVTGGPLLSVTSDVEPVTTYLVVVAKWSDGTLAVPAAKSSSSQTHHHHG